MILFFISKQGSVTWLWKEIRAAVLDTNLIASVAFVRPSRQPDTQTPYLTPAHRPSLSPNCFFLTISILPVSGLGMLTILFQFWASVFVVHEPKLLVSSSRKRKVSVQHLSQQECIINCCRRSLPFHATEHWNYFPASNDTHYPFSIYLSILLSS